MFVDGLSNSRVGAATFAAGVAQLVTLGIAISIVLSVALAGAQENGVSLGELARKERERKAAAAKPEQVIDLLNLKRDCGGDWSCFLAALKEGKPARITFPDTAESGASANHSAEDSAEDAAGDLLGDSEGLVIHSEVVLETDKLTEDSAVLSGTTKNTTVLLTDPERARLLLKGYTRDAIDARERQAQEKAKRQDGSFVTCFFQKKALQQFLEKRKEGEFSDRDWELAEHCDGPGDGPDRVAAPNSPSPSPNP